MRLNLGARLALAFLLLLPLPLHANCSTPTAAIGSLKWFTTQFKYCDGTTWQNFAGGTAAGSTGNVQFNNSNAFAGDSNLFWDNTNKRLGIGTATPDVTFTVSKNASGLQSAAVPSTVAHFAGADGASAIIKLDGYGGTPMLRMFRYDGTAAAPTAIQSGDVLAQLGFFGYSGAGASSSANIQVLATETWTNSTAGSAITFATTQNASGGFGERMRIDNTGNVGIGTASPSVALQVHSAITQGSAGGILVTDSTGSGTTAGVGGQIIFGGIYTGSSITGWSEIQGVKENATAGNYAGALSFLTRPNGGSQTEAMRITSAGKVGIGTTAPAADLHVKSSTGTIEVDNGTYSATLSQGSSYVTTLAMSSAGKITWGTSAALNFNGTSSTTNWSLYDNSLFTNNANTTILAGHSGALGFLTNGSTTEFDALKSSFTDNNTVALIFNSKAGGTDTERMRITSAGNVGIGTTSPTALLHTAAGNNTSTTTTIASGATTTNWYVTNNLTTDTVTSVAGTTVSNGDYTLITPASTLGSQVVGRYNWIQIPPTDTYGSTSSVIGAANYVRDYSSGNVATMYGLIGAAQNFSTGTMTSAYGVQGIAGNQTNGSNQTTTLTNSYAVFASSQNGSTGGTVTNQYGVYDNGANSGTVTNGYGLYITGFAAGTHTNTPFDVYAADTSASNYFAGNVGIGTTSPGSALDVKGTLRLEGSTSGYVGFAPAAAAGSTTYTLPSADGSSGQMLRTNGSGTLSWATPTASPGGSTTQVQFNSSGSLTGDSGFTYAGSGAVTITGAATMALSVTTSSTSGYAIYANETDTTNTTTTGYFVNASSTGRALYASDTATSGYNTTALFYNSSTNGTGLSVNANAATGGTTGGLFQIASSGNGSAAIQAVGNATSGGTYAGYFLNYSSGGYGVVGDARSSTGSTTAGYFVDYSSSGTGVYATNTNGGYALVTASGNVGISSLTPVYPLDVVGDIRTSQCLRYNSSTLGTCSSDIALKKNIAPYTPGLNTVSALKPVTYYYNGLGGNPDDGKQQIGFIAQDVEKVAPQLVGKQEVKLHPADKNTTTVKTVNYSAITYMLVNAVRELKADNDNLKADNNNLHHEIEALRREIQAR